MAKTKPSRRTESVQPLSIGIIGAGGIAAKMHLPQIERIKGVKIAALAGRKESRLKVLSKRHGGEIFTDYRAVIENPKIDAIVIATPHPHHVNWGIAALDAGKHVFCQARMAMNTADARIMLERAQRSDRTTMLCPPPHYMPGDRLIRRLIGEGYLGDLYHLNVRMYA